MGSLARLREGRRVRVEHVDPGNVHAPQVAVEVALEGPMPVELLLDQCVSGGAHAVRAAPVLDLPIVVLFDELRYEGPVVEPTVRGCVAAVLEQMGQRVDDVVAAGGLERLAEVAAPRQGREQPFVVLQVRRHQRRLVREDGADVVADGLATLAEVGFVGHFDEAGHGLAVDDVDVGQGVRVVADDMGALEHAPHVEREDAPDLAVGRGPGEGLGVAGRRFGGEVDGAVEVVAAAVDGRGAHAQGTADDALIRGHGVADGAGALGAGAEHADRLEFGMVAQGQAAGLAAGIALFVVEPQFHAALAEGGDALAQRLPLGVVLEVVVKADVRDDPRVPVALQAIGQVRIARMVHDLQHAVLPRRVCELLLHLLHLLTARDVGGG